MEHPGTAAAPLTARAAVVPSCAAAAAALRERHSVALLFGEHHVKMLLHHWAI